jgi:hypothetical protein
MIPKRRKPQKLGLRAEPQIRSQSHMAWVRGHECAVAGTVGMSCSDRIEAAHVRVGTDGGMGVKPGDNWVLPLCSAHHAQQHALGETTFAALHKINMKQIAAELWVKSPHRRKAEQS